MGRQGEVRTHVPAVALSAYIEIAVEFALSRELLIVNIFLTLSDHAFPPTNQFSLSGNLVILQFEVLLFLKELPWVYLSTCGR